jgi:ParG
VEALGQLAPADRDKVYTWLLGTSLHLQPGLASPLSGQLTRAIRADAPPDRQQDFAEAEAEVMRNLFRSPASAAAQQMVPVRFSAEQHARLRAWCSEHGFSMATVIRGLVDRFLDGQQAAAG